MDLLPSCLMDSFVYFGVFQFFFFYWAFVETGLDIEIYRVEILIEGILVVVLGLFWGI